MYSKTPTLKKTTAQITSFSSLIMGAALLIFSGKMPLSWLAQLIGIIFLTLSIYVMSCYLLREYVFCVEASNKASDNAPPDLVIYENKGYKKLTVCRLGFDELVGITEVNKENRKKIREERKNMQRFRYNAQYAAQKFIEVRTEDISVFMTYDKELLSVLSAYFSKYGKNASI